MIKRTINIQGTVQGVGFRPFVFQLATELGLTGTVGNNSLGVTIELFGSQDLLDDFLRRLQTELPPLASIRSFETADETIAEKPASFIILPSRNRDVNTALIPADVATCDACLKEFQNPRDRRYRYPFINCTHCGPRFTIIRDTPYDRPLTTMADFPLCDDCRREYENPSDRRFHAQPNACPVCGPVLSFLDNAGNAVPVDDVTAHAAALLNAGAILAVKGLGGFHLACDAANERAVIRLRQQKVRQAKPFAVMARDEVALQHVARISPGEQSLLQDRLRPIVLLSKSADYTLPDALSPDNDRIGVMLPYTPFHHRLMQLAPPLLVMTSGNRADEPIAFENDEAVSRLGAMVDGLVVHNRPIHNRCDDSVAQVAGNRVQWIRRSRGCVPQPLPGDFPGTDVLGVGAQQKNLYCFIRQGQALVGPHIGDMDSVEALDYFTHSLKRMSQLYHCHPQVLACDRHPDYLSTRWAREQKEQNVIAVQHHHAHIVSVMAEHHRFEPVIGIALDGTGLGDDGAIWGGEVLLTHRDRFERMGHLEYVGMPGSEAAVREPWRMALAYIYQAMNKADHDVQWEAFRNAVNRWPGLRSVAADGVRAVFGLLKAGMNTPLTSSAGRLFDAVAALLGLCSVAGYEGQGAVMLEAALARIAEPDMIGEAYQMPLLENGGEMVLNTTALIDAMLRDVESGQAVEVISLRFHRALVRSLVQMAGEARRRCGIQSIALSGGCFVNRFLTRHLEASLKREGFEVLMNKVLPPNDGNIAFGQAITAQAVVDGNPSSLS